MDGGLCFNSWSDYLGLSSLISRGLQPREGGESPRPRWKASSPTPAEPLPSKAAEAHGHKGCGFCRSNREAQSLYSSHRLRAPDGRVLCPVLRGYTCPLCGANGDWAHTMRYCPLRHFLRHPHSPRDGQ
ncbi:nanos homolog 1 [Xenopus tropicalis]|uniref:Nanos homolog 1 n=1 Tax=Xenopus tropicalis TaxID=8364 RepID=NANO1_XENTR|nr:nanos homolog 1 [Xenopus tropicalis]Q90ZZ6.1 RecName: Full=Nanos homolog 1; AltName: Full=Xcat-2 protein [Xenopus tropicalis]AAI60384.1 nanos1 protein [Xenopus tropicalis]AAK49295.1 Xcat-2 [Xenopus tropicalis]|eukprot:NP_988857.1 nanos homolog 1 [Xenopus tropicalis]